MRAVLEMKSTELHNLRIENMNLKKEVERIPDYQERIHKLESKVEELVAIVERKQVYERLVWQDGHAWTKWAISQEICLLEGNLCNF